MPPRINSELCILCKKCADICPLDVVKYKEANSTLQKIMDDYVGTRVRSATLLTAGRKYINDLRRYARKMLKAENSHELMRCLEALDLLDLAEACALSALNREESRGPWHKRSDFPFTNPLLNNKFQTVSLTPEGLKTTFRERVRQACSMTSSPAAGKDRPAASGK